MNEQLVTFFGALGNVARVAANAHRQLNREVAPNFSAMKLLQPDENRLSDTIACLFDPAEAHGQGSRFLDLFIDMFEINCPLDRTRCHVARERGRLDILVEIGSGKPFAIGIENKPWADDQDAQVERYCAYLEKNFPGQWWFGYFSGNGKPPPDQSISALMRKNLENNGQFRTIPFARSRLTNEYSMEDWLGLCVKDCVAGRVRWFLRDMQDYVRANFRELQRETDNA